MMKWWLATPLVVALLLLTVVPSCAWRGGTRVFVGVGVAPVWWAYPYWYYPPPPYYVYAPPTVIVQQPPVYVEQPPALPSPPAGSAPATQQFWYYCQPAGVYYPNVQACADPWIKVPARAQ